MQRREFVQLAAALGLSGTATGALAHHGWSSFDQSRPIYLEGKAADVKWRNPHVELVLELPETLRLPADLAQRALPAQTAGIDGPALLAKAVVPTRRDRRWEVELAPLFRLGQWQMPEIKNGEALSLVGFTFKDEAGAAVVRAEYVFLGGKVYGLRSSPA
ncbi:DUF6152 family protein [Hydrogenophaga sp.]|uniref:DUF6152 family protein n=1 Tax=Hydrogenophaga sp. TaxID=1904254 RepID=UPI00273166B5|nr:DUF6152 family protein [Hydrogenophaga sp.]MDP2019039.1 DUF6152 family protein [Hydrogenophaga sp.]MDP3164013.1 DUF6152 family protein [Hydrogenophaga sp.]